jgi:hypothetical protein
MLERVVGIEIIIKCSTPLCEYGMDCDYHYVHNATATAAIRDQVK